MTRSIVFLSTHSAAGGVQELWANLADGFQDRGFRASLAALYPFASGGPGSESPAAWRYVVARRPSGVWQTLSLLPALVRFFRAERPDLVVTAMPAANVLAPIAAKLAGRNIRVAISHHSPAHTHNAMLDAADRWTGCLDNVQTVVSVSDAVASSLDGKPGRYRAKRRTIHNALPPRLERLLATLAGRPPRRATRRLVVAMGRLAPEKNYPMLLRAAVHMPSVSIAVIGTGPDDAMLRDLARSLGVADRVTFLGQMQREDALARLSGGDLFVQVSLFEGHSLALIEAAQLGMPLIVSDAPSQIEGITASDGTRCGIIVSRDDAAGLAREILQLLDEPSAYAHWAARARQLAAGATYDTMIAAYLELASLC